MLSKGAEKVGDEFRAVVRSDMFQKAVFGEHVHIARSLEVQWMVVGMNMPCLESRSTITRIELQPEDIIRVSMKSIEMEFHGRLGIGSCFSKP